MMIAAPLSSTRWKSKPRFGGRGVWAALVLLALLLPLPVAAQKSKTPKTISAWKDSIAKAEQRFGEEWSVWVEDLATGKTIVDYHGERRLIPASNRKIVTFALALEYLGPEYRFRTELGYTGSIDVAAKTLNGSLVLRSDGDPTMSPGYLNGKNPVSLLRGWFATLPLAGVQRVTGDMIIDASAFGWLQGVYPAEWDPSHMNHSYASLPSAIALNKNLLRITVKPSATLGAPGRIEAYPSPEGLGIINQTRTTSGRQQGLEAKFLADGRNIVVSGRVGQRIKAHVVSLPLRQPLNYVRLIVEDSLKAEGIEIGGSLRVLNEARQAAMVGPLTGIHVRHESDPLADLLRRMLRDSDNFLAEQIWRTTAARALGRGDPLAARSLEQKWYADKGLTGIEAGADGSGLSRQNRVAAKELVAILRTVYASPYRPYLLDSLPSSGRSGTLRGRTWGYKSGRVVAKTGTLSGAGALAGFIRDRQGRERWTFAMIGNAPKNTNGRLTTRINQLMKVLLRSIDSGGTIEKAAPKRPRKKRYQPGTKQYVEKPS